MLVVKNPAYLVVILLARVVTRLGTLPAINTKVIESLYATDVAYLQELYNGINRLDDAPPVRCPQCQHTFRAEVAAAVPERHVGAQPYPEDGQHGRDAERQTPPARPPHREEREVQHVELLLQAQRPERSVADIAARARSAGPWSPAA